MDFKNIFFNISDYQLIKRPRIGKGNFGSVYKCQNIKTHQIYAAKIIDIRDGFDGNDQMLIMRESMVLSTLNHPSIIKFYGINFMSFDEDHLSFQPTILTEFLPKGSLKKILDDERLSLADFSWCSTKKYICLLGISNAMRYIHQHGILHLDLKPENILIDDNYYPKVCDFSFSRFLPENFSNSMRLVSQGQYGTPLYMAPELFNIDANYQYSPSVDVYAFAMLAYEVITGQLPFFELNLNWSQLKIRILNGQKPSLSNIYISDKMEQLLNKCWNSNFKDRPSFEEIFKELSSDFSYWHEKIDEKEINDYIETIKEEKDKNIETSDSIIENYAKKFYYNDFHSLLYYSIRDNNYQISELLLKKIKSTNIGYLTKSYDYHAPLYTAVKYENVEVVKLILSLPTIDVNSRYRRRFGVKSALFKAVQKNNVEIVKLLLSRPEIDINDQLKKLAFGESKYESLDDSEVFRWYTRCEYEKGALHVAVENNNIEIVKLLLSRPDININFLSIEKLGSRIFGRSDYKYKVRNALHIAVENSNIEIVKLLLSKPEIIINIQSKYCNYHCIVVDRYVELLKNRTALEIAIEQNNIEIVELLLSKPGININIQTEDFSDYYMKHGTNLGSKITALKIAVLNKNYKIIKLLLNQNSIIIDDSDKEKIIAILSSKKEKIDQLITKINH